MISNPLENENKPKKRVVVDTSIIIAAVISDGAYRKLIRKLLAADFELCIPQEVLDEFNEIIQENKFKKYHPLFIQILDELRKSSILLPYPTKIKFKTDEFKEDEGIINCCVENHIDYLVTSDKETEGAYNGLKVIFAQKFYSSFLLD